MQYIFLLLPMLFSSEATMPVRTNSANVSPKPAACRFFGSDYALKMIGQKVIAKEEESTSSEDRTTWRCAFTAASGDSDAPRISFLLSKSVDVQTAKKEFEDVRRSNLPLPGFEEWPGAGDEAIIHSDGANFHLIMIRKSDKTIRLKVNPAARVSVEVVKAVALALERRLEQEGKNDR